MSSMSLQLSVEALTISGSLISHWKASVVEIQGMPMKDVAMIQGKHKRLVQLSSTLPWLVYNYYNTTWPPQNRLGPIFSSGAIW